jgi:YbgC/YbaW family acyl-CoA thioester hydrolase
MPPRLSEFTLRRRVQFAECDSAGIVHFSRYFRFMEEAEHALWRAVGLSIAPRGADVGFPRVAAAFDYTAPLQFEDEVDVRIQVVKKSDRALGYRCVITREGATVATGTMTIVCVDRRARPLKAIPIPADIADRFEVAPLTASATQTP